MIPRSPRLLALLLLVLFGTSACKMRDVYLGADDAGSAGSGATTTDGGHSSADVDASASAGDAGSREIDAGDMDPTHASQVKDASPAAVPCGSAQCSDGEVCCSASCGLCTAADSCKAIDCAPPDQSACVAADCGPTLGATMEQVCDDGTSAGPRCERDSHGQCAWVETQCAAHITASVVCQGDPGECSQGSFCNRGGSKGCADPTQSGVCTELPAQCGSESAPVCGCDGKTYRNACLATSQQVSIDHAGACDAPRCGTIAGIACAAGEYCDLEQGDGCDVADGAGVCAMLPTACTKEYAPVCGCDGKTYGNACTAAAAGISVRTHAACK